MRVEPFRPTRRRVLALLGSAATLASAKTMAQPADALLARKAAAAGVTLPVVGVGTWQTFDVGRDAPERAELAEVLRTLVQQGGSVVNLTKYLYDTQETTDDYGTPAFEERAQARRDGVHSVYVEDATFVKLRELSVMWDVPQRVTAAMGLGVRNLRVGVTGVVEEEQLRRLTLGELLQGAQHCRRVRIIDDGDLLRRELPELHQHVRDPFYIAARVMQGRVVT